MKRSLRRRPLRAADRRVRRALLALAFEHRERSIVLEALGVQGAAAWREGRSLDGLLEVAELAEGGLELLEGLLRGELRASEHASLDCPAAIACAWERAHDGAPRQAAGLLFLVATSEGWVMRRLEQRMLEELEARVWRGAGTPRTRSPGAAPRRAAEVLR